MARRDDIYRLPDDENNKKLNLGRAMFPGLAEEVDKKYTPEETAYEKTLRIMGENKRKRLETELAAKQAKLDEMQTEEYKAARLAELRGAQEIDGREARFNSGICGPGYEEIAAPQTGGVSGRPRAEKCCYGHNLEDEGVGPLYILMKTDQVWIEYSGVDYDEWQDLKDTDSTDQFVRSRLNGKQWRNIGSASSGPSQFIRRRNLSFNQGAEE